MISACSASPAAGFSSPSIPAIVITEPSRREAVTVPGDESTIVEQLTDSVTTHGRTNAEDRLNSGGNSTVQNSTTEES